MSEDNLALGQREVVPGIEFRPEELALIEQNGHTVEEILAFVEKSGLQTINAAIGGLSGEKANATEGGEAATTEGGTEAAASESEAQPEGEPSGEASEEAKTE